MVDSDDVVVDQVTEPTRADKRGRYVFRRDQAASQFKVTEAWRRSSGTLVYLGEWHTHPEPVASPSPHDMEDQVRVLMGVRCEQQAIFFVIAGTEGTAVWEGAVGTRSVSALPLVQSTPEVEGSIEHR